MNQFDILNVNTQDLKEPFDIKLEKISSNSQIREVYIDLIQGVQNWRLWWYMAYADIRRRYRRTVIGPFWTTLSLSIFIGFTSILFCHLWKMDIENYMPFFASGFICWSFISSMIMEGCGIFISSEGLMKQIPLPYSTFAWHLVARNLLVLAHHAIVYIFIMIVFKVPINWSLVLLIPALFLLCITGIWVSILVGFICARYRDLQQVIGSLLQISIFVTPIFWPVAQLGESSRAVFFLKANFLYHFVSLIRLPLLGQIPSSYSWFVTILVSIIGWMLTIMLLVRKRRLLIYWL